ncbi:serine/threonine-protein kinase [Actinomadura napierensis]|uniref:non-specific serine/threonine protein kinase n=1 Tax=Actinomadura napierensis TaxID=267854 RepID=A0ABN3A3W4_9ACTN
MSDCRLIGRYRLGTLLGAGGMGAVWRGYDELLGRDVAIKRIILDGHVPPEERAVLCARAAREARAAAMLDHSGIITVHDVVETDGEPWIVMELVEGRSLGQTVAADGPLPPERVAEIGARLLEALTAAHGQGIVHRDVKPANVLLAEDGRIVLTDFGIAALDGDPALTREGALVGSPGFIAPERLRDEPAGPASDLWSLGATLYTAVEGRAPFDGPAPLAALGATVTGEAPFPERADALAPVLLCMLEKDPAKRIGAEQAATALYQVAAGGDSGLYATPPARSPSGARPDGRGASSSSGAGLAGWLPGRSTRRGTVVAIGVIAVVTVAATVGVLLVHGHGTDHGPARPATVRVPRPVASVDPCAVLDDQQARGLLAGAVRRGDTPRTGECSWLAPKAAAMLTVYKPVVVAASFEAARDRMAIKRNELLAYVQQLRTSPFNMTYTWPYDGFPKTPMRLSETTSLTALPGVGDEAVTYTSRYAPPHDEVNVFLREGNVVLQLQWSGPRTGPAAAADGARRAGVEAARTLARLENRA